VCHCGETFNPWIEEELAYILETLRLKRLGHGIQLHRFPALMKIASAQGTELEICISSNFATRVVRTKREFARY
jgi:adenosine deaminase